MEKFNARKLKYARIVSNILGLLMHCEKCHEKIELQDAKRILIIESGLIGDIIMATSFFRILKRNAPNAKITLVCGRWAQTVLDGQDLIDEYITIDTKIIDSPRKMLLNWTVIRRIIRAINVNEYDLALETKGDLRYIFFMHFCNAKRKISYNYTGGESLLTDVIIPSEEVKHLVEDRVYFAEQLGCHFSSKERTPSLVLNDENKKKNSIFIQSNEIENKIKIGIHPGASLDIKRWKKYDDLIRTLNIDNAVYLIFSGPGEEGLSHKIIEAGIQSGKTCIEIREKLDDYVRLMAVPDVCICNDSGAGHLSAAYGIPTISILGPSIPEYCRPYTSKGYVLSHTLECKPCLARECRTGTYECIDGISVEEVKNEVYKAISDC